MMSALISQSTELASTANTSVAPSCNAILASIRVNDSVMAGSTGNEHGQDARACANVQHCTPPVRLQSGSNCGFDGCSIFSIAGAIIQHGEVPTVQHLSRQPLITTQSKRVYTEHSIAIQ